ncbi:MAG: hypothetical protein GX323_07550 [Clostridiales bacterium]|nr:hypothetical protein [Clostridiales bacterium]
MKSKEFGGLFLIVIGLLLLLFNLGYINFNVFTSFFDLWPLLLIAIGINIIFKNNRIVSYITWGLFFVIIIAYGIFTQDNSNTMIGFNSVAVEKFSETKYGNLNLGIGASKIIMDSTDKDLISADLRGRPLDFNERYKNNNEIAIIDFQSRKFNIRGQEKHKAVYDFYLNKDVIWDINFDLGAVSCEINLEDIPVKNIDLDSGASDLTFILGNKHDLNFEIDTGASNINIVIPKDVGLKIDIDSALSNSNIKDMNLIKRGDYYISQNYDNASIRINLDIDMGLGNINFSYR